MNTFPRLDELVIQFAHPSYQMAERFSRRNSGINHFQTRTAEETLLRIGEPDILVISGLWNNSLLESCGQIRYLQAISAGYEQFNLDWFRDRSIRLANASGVNADAVSQHAMGFVLALSRQFHLARDNQRKTYWRPMISDRLTREDDLNGQTMLIIGLGSIGSRLAKIAKAFQMIVLGVKRDIQHYEGVVDAIYKPEDIAIPLKKADFIVLCCPLTEATQNIINTDTLSQMKSSSYIVNVARGGCIDEPALISALETKMIAGAALDHFSDDPLALDSPFWGIDSVIITPHSAGETRKYEDNVIDILMSNIELLLSGEKHLVNQIV